MLVHHPFFRHCLVILPWWLGLHGSMTRLLCVSLMSTAWSWRKENQATQSEFKNNKTRERVDIDFPDFPRSAPRKLFLKCSRYVPLVPKIWLDHYPSPQLVLQRWPTNVGGEQALNNPILLRGHHLGCGTEPWNSCRFPAVTVKSEARLWVVIILGKAGRCPEAWGAARSWGQWRPRPWETRGWRDDGMMGVYITVKNGNINITNVIYEPLGTFFCPRRLGSRIIRHFHLEVCKTRQIYIELM